MVLAQTTNTQCISVLSEEIAMKCLRVRRLTRAYLTTEIFAPFGNRPLLPPYLHPCAVTAALVLHVAIVQLWGVSSAGLSMGRQTVLRRGERGRQFSLGLATGASLACCEHLMGGERQEYMEDRLCRGRDWEHPFQWQFSVRSETPP